MLKLLEAAIIVLIILDFFIPSTFPEKLHSFQLCVFGGWTNMELDASFCVYVCALQESENERVYVLIKAVYNINKFLHVRLSRKPKHAFVIVIFSIHLLLCVYAFVCGRPCCLENYVSVVASQKLKASGQT